MTNLAVRVVAPSRLHFGMLSVNQPQTRRYGGVGAMVDAPGLELVIQPAAGLEAVGPLADRALKAARLAVRSLYPSPACERGEENDELCQPRCRIEIVRAPPLHVGLGTGTQLAMAVAAGLNAWRQGPPMEADHLARCVERGKRSAVGLYGFVYGGLLYEAGKMEEDQIAPLAGRAELPPAWRFLLVRPRDQHGLSDEAERDAFAHLPPAPVERTEKLQREAAEHLLPAAAAGRFEEFSESLYRFGRLAGLNFAATQGGAFGGPWPATLIPWLRSRGVRGVGQSSWGPTLFAVLPDESSARDLARQLRARPDADTLELTIASPANRGARVEMVTRR